jgi:hypothetical protein
MVVGRHVEVRNVMPGGLVGHLGKIQCRRRQRLSSCANDRHLRKRLEPALCCCCPVRESPLGLLLGPMHFFGVWSWVQWRGRVSAVSLVFSPLKPVATDLKKTFSTPPSTPSRRIELGSGAIEPGRDSL